MLFWIFKEPADWFLKIESKVPIAAKPDWPHLSATVVYILRRFEISNKRLTKSVWGTMSGPKILLVSRTSPVSMFQLCQGSPKLSFDSEPS